jgi:hypothetical protein
MTLIHERRGETVWKIRMGSTLRSHESRKRCKKHPYRRFAPPTGRRPDPSTYFPNSFGRGILGSSYPVRCIGIQHVATVWPIPPPGSSNPKPNILWWWIDIHLCLQTNVCFTHRCLTLNSGNALSGRCYWPRVEPRFRASPLTGRVS